MNLSARLATLLLVALVAAVGAEDAVQVALSKCASDNGLPSDILKKACDGEIVPEKLESYKCYTQCVQQTVGIMSADGTVNPDIAAKSLVDEGEREIMRGIAKECQGSPQAANLCEKAFSVDQCYSSKNKTMYRKNCNKLMVASGLA